MFMSVCIFAWMVCASALSFLDGKICAIQEPSIIIIIIMILLQRRDRITMATWLLGLTRAGWLSRPGRKGTGTRSPVCHTPLPQLNSRSGELRTQKLKSHLVRTQSLNVLPLKPGVGQYNHDMLHLLPGISFLLISTLPVHSPAFFPKPLTSFSCVGCGWHRFLCRPAE